MHSHDNNLQELLATMNAVQRRVLGWTVLWELQQLLVLNQKQRLYGHGKGVI